MKLKISQQSVELVNFMGNDLSVVNAARVSFDKLATNYTQEQNEKLIGYLAKHNHWSPFAHTAISLRIKAPLFVAAQMKKHQVGGVWNEVSRRYVDSEPEFYIPDVLRGKAENAKQGSSDVDVTNYICDYDYGPNTCKGAIKAHSDMSLYLYNQLLKNNVAPEQARMVLPQNTMTEWVWTGSLLFFNRVYKQRIDAHAQKETQEIAQLINDVVAPLFPVSWKALTK